MNGTAPDVDPVFACGNLGRWTRVNPYRFIRIAPISIGGAACAPNQVVVASVSPTATGLRAEGGFEPTRKSKPPETAVYNFTTSLPGTEAESNLRQVLEPLPTSRTRMPRGPGPTGFEPGPTVMSSCSDRERSCRAATRSTDGRLCHGITGSHPPPCPKLVNIYAEPNRP